MDDCNEVLGAFQRELEAQIALGLESYSQPSIRLLRFTGRTMHFRMARLEALVRERCGSPCFAPRRW